MSGRGLLFVGGMGATVERVRVPEGMSMAEACRIAARVPQEAADRAGKVRAALYAAPAECESCGERARLYTVSDSFRMCADCVRGGFDEREAIEDAPDAGEVAK